MGKLLALLVLAALAVLLSASSAFASAPLATAAAVNCSDFSTQAAAQAYFISRGGPALDPEGLDGDGNGIACQSLPCPCNYSTTPTTPPSPPAPPPPDTDADGVPDPTDVCPTVYAATPDGCPPPPPPPVYAGTLSVSYFGQPGPQRPRELHPYGADDNAWLYGLRWRRWGEARAYAQGKGAANNCLPNCAGGRYLRKRGAQATLFRLRSGTCDGERALFYTRALLRFPRPFRARFPRGLGLRPFTVKLQARCEP
jgi:Excalibur calcium-binding domain